MTGRTGRYGIEGIRRHRLEIDAAKHDDDARRLLAACRGELRARIGDVVHVGHGKAGLPRTACGDAGPAMNPSEIDCMGCLVNTARGLEVEDDLRIRWRGVTHAAVWEMGPGCIVAACKFEQRNPYGSHTEWQRRSDTT